MKVRTVVHISGLMMLICCCAIGQVATGTPAYNSFGGGPFDTVNLGNLNVHLDIPIVNKAGRGLSFTYDLGYDSSVWMPTASGGSSVWAPVVNWGWRGITEITLGYASYKSFQDSCTNDNTGQQYYFTHYYDYAYHDKFGVVHDFPFETGSFVPSRDCSTGLPLTASGTAQDGSGYYMSVDLSSITYVQTRSGITLHPPVNVTNGSGSRIDPNGNEITTDGNGNFYDTLSSTTQVLTVSGAGTPASPMKYQYTAPGGSATVTTNYTQYTVKTDFGISTIGEYGPLSNSLVSSISLPDGSEYTFTYEQTPGSCTPLSGTSECVTGRIASVTLPTGGTINYTYTGGSNGIESDGSAAGLNRTLTPGGEWSYSRTLSGSTWITTVVDPNANNTVINFAKDGGGTNSFYETQRQVYQGSVSTSNLLLTSIRCYNAFYTGCSTGSVSSPITQTDIYTQLPNNSTRLSHVVYNGNGLMTDDKEYNYGVAIGTAPGTTDLVRETAISYASLGNGINNKPSSVIVNDWSSGSAVTLASSSYGYDQTTPTATSGTPQHVSISGSRGNLTTSTTSTSSTASLSKTFTYYDTGNLNVTTDVNGAQTTYNYSSATNPYNSSLTASCGNSFVTSISEPLGLSRSMQWNCAGGINPQVTDESGNNVTSSYTDPDFWRPASVTDQMNNQTKIIYDGEIAVEAALQNFNGGNSVSDSRTTVDGFGRPTFSQRLQTPGGTNYDTTEVDYNNVGQPYRSTMPYTATASPSSDNTTIPATNTTYDALGRVLTVVDKDNGQTSYTYTNNDVLVQVSGSQVFTKQLEYDGLGRLSSVCEISSTLPGVGTCAQGTSKTGYWTKYTYDALGHLLTATQNAQAASGSQQKRTFTYDMAGRLTSETNPETGNNGTSGTTTYVYDTIPSPGICGGWTGIPGDLLQIVRPAGDWTCYEHDLLHRLTAVGNNSQTTTNPCKRFRYDASGNGYVSPPSGATLSNIAGRLMEVETDSGSTITDEWFSYDKDGRLTDVWESTPHSGGYYHTNASYWPTGALDALSGIPGVPTIYYGASNGSGLDGEGRITQVTASSGTAPVTSVSYSTSSTTNYLGALIGVTFGSGDSDAFTYDSNTGRMGANSTTPAYTFTVNGKTDSGTLTWNSNGTLAKLVVNDTIPGTADSQTCTYGYDDLQRVSNVTCGTFWVQNFTYDAFGNIVKNVPSGDGGLNFLPTYWTSPPTNQFESLPGVAPQYDADGQLLTDNLNTYTWNVYGEMATVTPTGGSAVTSTYDGLGRMVENNAGGSYAEFVYGPTGAKLAKCNGQALVKAFVALPGGAKAIYNSSGLAYYRHSDWLGSSRLTSTASRTMYSSSAYAPFGEQYATAGSADASFTGQDQDTVSNLYDFPARRQSPSQGRWISPDPAGRSAVSLTNPQSWNRYAYVNNNPLRLIDSLGTDPCADARHGGGVHAMDGCSDDDDDDGGGGGGGGGDDNSGGCDPTVDANCNDPSQNCDAACQAAQNMSYALNDPACATAVDGNSGAAAAALGAYLDGNNGSQYLTIANIQTGYEAGFYAFTDSGVYTSTITLNSGPGGFYSIGTTWIGQGPVETPGDIYMYGIAGYGPMAAMAMVFGHELGHAAVNAGYQSAVVSDNTASAGDPNAAQTENIDLSNQNNEAIGNACFPQGDFGGNQGPVDSPPTDVPAIAKPVKHHF